VPASSQRRALGALFLVLTAVFAGVAATAASAAAAATAPAGIWVVAGAAAVLAAWMGSLSWQMLRPRN
jgi:hypothetical protein